MHLHRHLFAQARCFRARAVALSSTCTQHQEFLCRSVCPAHARLTSRSAQLARSYSDLNLSYLDEKRPPIPARKGDEYWFVAPYPTPDTQFKRRIDCQGKWFTHTPLYPLARHWTDSPQATWPNELRLWHYKLRYQGYKHELDDAYQVAEDLELYYPEDQEILAFTRWLRWQLQDDGAVDLICLSDLEKQIAAEERKLQADKKKQGKAMDDSRRRPWWYWWERWP